MQLKNDRGSADPILMVAVMAVGMVLIGFTAAWLLHMLSFSSNYATSQQTRIALTQAEQAFSTDAASSTSVSVADGKSGTTQAVTFYSPITATTAGMTCQASTWQATAADQGDASGTLGGQQSLGQGIVLEDTVRLSKDSTCATIPSGSGTVAFRVPQWAGLPTFTFKNDADSTITWVGGKVTKVTPDASIKAEGYATAAELADTQTATVILTGQVKTAIGGSTSITFSGHAQRSDVDLTQAPTPETAPGRALFAPSATPVVKKATSGFTTVAGEVQGITVAGADTAPQCGALPYADVRLVSEPVKPSGAATTFDEKDIYSAAKVTGKVGLGAGGRIQVELTESCPPVADGGNQKGTPAAKTVTYTQPLPAPKVTLTEVSPSRWKATWDKVSSLPTTFTVTEKIAGGTFATASTTATSLTFNTPAPAFGTKVAVTVKATAGVLTASGSAASSTLSWGPATWVPYLHGTGTPGEQPVSHTVYTTGAGCAAGTSLTVRAYDTGIGRDGGWASGESSYAMSEAYATSYRAVGEARCSTPYSTSVATTASITWKTAAHPPAPPAHEVSSWAGSLKVGFVRMVGDGPSSSGGDVRIDMTPLPDANIYDMSATVTYALVGPVTQSASTTSGGTFFLGAKCGATPVDASVIVRAGLSWSGGIEWSDWYDANNVVPIMQNGCA